MSEALSAYQQGALNEMKKNPRLMKLLGTIFRDYPAIIIEEVKLRSAVTSKNKKAMDIATKARLNLEAFVEKEICEFAGVNLEGVKKSTGTNIQSEVSEVDKALEEARAKKKTAKKVTSKKGN